VAAHSPSLRVRHSCSRFRIPPTLSPAPELPTHNLGNFHSSFRERSICTLRLQSVQLRSPRRRQINSFEVAGRLLKAPFLCQFKDPTARASLKVSIGASQPILLPIRAFDKVLPLFPALGAGNPRSARCCEIYGIKCGQNRKSKSNV